MPTSDATTGRTGDTGAPGVGDVIAGKYRVEQVLGRGGMGVVLLAVHEQLEDRVALKVLLPEVARDQDVVDRFIHEARAAKSLRSENVVKVLDIGTLESGAPFMVMEFLEGEDLNARVERGGPLPVVEAVDHVLQAMVALAEAHASGLVHRDLKPANLFLTQRPDGSPLVKVLDFGISKRHQPDLIGGAVLAQTQRLMGSPLYMSPEQLRSGRLVDGRSDLWSLGVTLFELITGRCPFEAESMSAVMISIASDPPMTFGRLGVAVPEGFEAVVMRCLEKDPARRFASAAEMAQALAPYASREGARAAESVLGVSLRTSRTSMLPPVALTPTGLTGHRLTPASLPPSALTPSSLPPAPRTLPPPAAQTPLPHAGLQRPASWRAPEPISTTLAGPLDPGQAAPRRWRSSLAVAGAAGLIAAGLWARRSNEATAAASAPASAAPSAPVSTVATVVLSVPAMAPVPTAVATAAAPVATAAVTAAPVASVAAPKRAAPASEKAPAATASPAAAAPAQPPDINDLIENRR